MSQLVEKIGTFEQYPSIDIPFHILGGYAIAHAIDTISNKTSTVSSVMLRTLLIGVAWEVYELMRGLEQTGFTPASGKDIIMDMV